MRDHPVIERIMRTGYPSPEPKPLGEDALGNEIYEGDELLVLDDYEFVKEELSYDAREILDMLGAITIIAEVRRW